MIIDFHTHYFPDDLAERAMGTILENVPVMNNSLNGTLNDLIKGMNDNNISKSVTLPVATKPEQVEIINKGAANLKNDKIIPFGSLHPLTDNFIEEINFLKNNNIKGVKLHPEYQQFMADDKNMYPLYDELSSNGMVVLFHAGKDPWPVVCKGGYPERLKKVSQDFPSLKIVAAHMGGWQLWEDVLKILAGENLYFDTSATLNELSPELFIKIINKQGCDKILFGTDSPWFSQKENIEFIDSLKINSEKKDRIFYKNALDILDF